MRQKARLDYAVKTPDETAWWLVHDGKKQEGEYPSADAAESAYSDKEGKR